MNTPLMKATSTKAEMSRPFVPCSGNTLYVGSATIMAGKTLKVETSLQGDELLEIECPAGKTWMVKFRIEVCEI